MDGVRFGKNSITNSILNRNAASSSKAANRENQKSDRLEAKATRNAEKAARKESGTSDSSSGSDERLHVSVDVDVKVSVEISPSTSSEDQGSVSVDDPSGRFHQNRLLDELFFSKLSESGSSVSVNQEREQEREAFSVLGGVQDRFRSNSYVNDLMAGQERGLASLLKQIGVSIS